MDACNCESSFCDHERGCATRPEGHWTMDYVGAICDGCAATATANGGGQYVHPTHDLAAEVADALTPHGLL